MNISTETPETTVIMSSYSLPGIRAIHYVRCSDLTPDLMLQSLCGIHVAVMVPAVAIEFSGKPSLKWDGSMVNGSRQEKSTLEFSTSVHLPEGENLAFIVTGAGGRQYLIGAREARFPVITYSETSGDPAGQAAVRTYKITHIAQKSVLPCVL